MVTRRQTLAGAAALAGTLATPALARPGKPGPFVQRKGTGFTLDGKPFGEYGVQALEDVGVAGFFGRIWDAILLFFQ